MKLHLRACAHNPNNQTSRSNSSTLSDMKIKVCSPPSSLPHIPSALLPALIIERSRSARQRTPSAIFTWSRFSSRFRERHRSLNHSLQILPPVKLPPRQFCNHRVDGLASGTRTRKSSFMESIEDCLLAPTFQSTGEDERSTLLPLCLSLPLRLVARR